MANCLGLGRSSNASGATNTSSSEPTSSVTPFTGTAPANGIQRGLWVGMFAFQLSIGWVVFNL
jgi:hypothetical protein